MILYLTGWLDEAANAEEVSGVTKQARDEIVGLKDEFCRFVPWCNMCPLAVVPGDEMDTPYNDVSCAVDILLDADDERMLAKEGGKA